MTAAEPAAQPSPTRAAGAIASGGSAIRAMGSIATFVAAIVAGVAIAFATAPPAAPLPTNPYPSLPALAAEPPAAASLVAAIAANDVKVVAETLTPDAVEELALFLDPIVTVASTRYLGGVERDGEQIAGYVINGTTELGEEVVVGLTLRVRDGKVVSIR